MSTGIDENLNTPTFFQIFSKSGVRYRIKVHTSLMDNILFNLVAIKMPAQRRGCQKVIFLNGHF